MAIFSSGARGLRTKIQYFGGGFFLVQMEGVGIQRKAKISTVNATGSVSTCFLYGRPSYERIWLRWLRTLKKKHW